MAVLVALAIFRNRTPHTPFHTRVFEKFTDNAYYEKKKKPPTHRFQVNWP